MTDTHPGASTPTYNDVQRGIIPFGWTVLRCDGCGHLFASKRQARALELLERHYGLGPGMLFAPHVRYIMQNRERRMLQDQLIFGKRLLKMMHEPAPDGVVVYTEAAPIVYVDKATD